MDNFDLKRFLVENKLTRNSILSELNELANIRKWTPEKLEQEAAKYNTPGEFAQADKNLYNIYRNAVRKGLIQNKFESNIKWTPEKLEQEAAKYNTPNEFIKADPNAYTAYRIAVRKGSIPDKFEKPEFGEKWTKDALEQEAVKYNTANEFAKIDPNAYTSYRKAVNKGLIQNRFEKTGFGNKWTKDTLEQEAAKYNTAGEFVKANLSAYEIYRRAVRKGLIQNKFETDIKWTKDALEQEANKYTKAGEFQKANINAYTAYRNAVNKGLIQNKFEERFIRTPEKLEQEAAKYNTASEFIKADPNAYASYRNAVKKGLIQDKFENSKIRKWTKDTLEQETAKYNTASEFAKTNLNAYVAYRRAIKKGIIQDKFKQDKNPTQSSNIYNNPYFGNTTTTFDKLEEGQFITEAKRLQKLAGIIKENK